ncbi:MAG: L,D-transpeptidase family protein [Pseudomonadota bacterium]
MAILIVIGTQEIAVAGGNTSYEKKVIDSVERIEQQDITDSIDQVSELVKQYPNSKLGHLILGDLLSLRGGNRSLVEAYGDDALQHDGLRDELRYRWQSSLLDAPAFQGMVPANLVLSPENHEFILVVDASLSRLFIFENRQSTYELVSDYYVTVGKAGMGKELEGDLRTPIGVYFVTSYIPGETLPPRYGPGAFPIDYPNIIDKRHKRTGYGIWLHGTEPENHNRVPLASDGCVSLSNEEFLEIAQYVDTDGTTPVLISTGFEWVEPTNLPQERQQFLDVINRWESDWESLNTDTYLSHYSRKEFKSDDFDFDEWVERKTRVNSRKSFIDIELSNIGIYTYPGEKDTFVATFNQKYSSDNYEGEGFKKQFWRRDNDGRWKIIYEG